ncbi:MutS protein msh5 [Puccinia graminis f. sp. tritici]|uniref:MutS protein msh5 n=1 Tax=Puccinia graminis f. sp. tritici TaxID=56615 RepID=A0A5B0LZX3_PUCGR|nr:MutS protein msh5 [Puccinia graminis f. sp. tritici]
MKSRDRLEIDLEPLASNIEELIDWSESKLNGGRVTIRSDVDEELDDYRGQYASMETQLVAEKVSTETPFKSLPGFSINYFPQIGYLCAIPFPTPSGSVDPSTLEDWEFQFSTDTEEHYKNGLMRELDDHYGDLATAIDDREIELVHILEEEVSKFTGILLSVNDDLAELDWYDPFPTVTFERAWVRPTILNQNTIQIIAGRHPLVEGCVENYIPNDTHLVASAPSKAQRKKRKSTESYTGNPMIVLTGANFSGKSVYLKQVAMIVIMAQLGSFVPAEEAHVGIHDAVFTRVSTTESASRSSSAFMIDLLRVSFMLRNCTARSLLLIDEFGKGTDPTDGQALFCGVIEHLISRGSSCPITLVSTHFHGVFTDGFLSLDLPIDYTHMCIVLKDGGGPEEENSPTYLYKLAPDLVSSSHAMGCAAQAGVPRHIRLKADRVSRLLSRHEILELLDVRLDEDEREELGRMEETVRRFVAIDFEQDGLSSCRDWMAYLRENVLENER